MENKKIGFYGVDNGDVILYLATTLKNLGKKVLILDLSSSEMLASAIPCDLDSRSNVVGHKGIDFTRMPYNSELNEDYDHVLINFGFEKNDSIKECSFVVYTTDQLKHNVDRLAEAENVPNAHQQLLIKDYVACKINQKYICEKLKLVFNKDEIYKFDLDTFDIKYRILSLYNPKITFRKLTKTVGEYLLNTLILLYPEKKVQVINKALRKARRGR